MIILNFLFDFIIGWGAACIFLGSILCPRIKAPIFLCLSIIWLLILFLLESPELIKLPLIDSVKWNFYAWIFAIVISLYKSFNTINITIFKFHMLVRKYPEVFYDWCTDDWGFFYNGRHKGYWLIHRVSSGRPRHVRFLSLSKTRDYYYWFVTIDISYNNQHESQKEFIEYIKKLNGCGGGI